MTPLHLYSADISPFAQRVIMTLEFKDLPFTQEHPPGGLTSDEYAAINPIRKLPVLRVDGVNLLESQVICEFLEDIHPEPSLLPIDPMARTRVRLIARIADMYVMNPMMPLFKNLSRKTRNQDVVDQALASVQNGLGWLDNWIAPARYTCGDRLTFADLAASPIIRYAAEYLPLFGVAEPFANASNLATYGVACREDELIDRALTRIEAGWAAARVRR